MAEQKASGKAEWEMPWKMPWEMTRDEYAGRSWRSTIHHLRDRPDILDAMNRDEEIAHFKQLHLDSVGKALSEGKPVPAEVLADYPDFAAR